MIGLGFGTSFIESGLDKYFQYTETSSNNNFIGWNFVWGDSQFFIIPLVISFAIHYTVAICIIRRWSNQWNKKSDTMT